MAIYLQKKVFWVKLLIFLKYYRIKGGVVDKLATLKLQGPQFDPIAEVHHHGNGVMTAFYLYRSENQYGCLHGTLFQNVS